MIDDVGAVSRPSPLAGDGLTDSPSGASAQDASTLLRQLADRIPQSASALFPQLYDVLHSIAARQMSVERPDHTLQATALLHEAWLRLDQSRLYNGPAHLLLAVTKIMRHLLIDHARAKGTARRGGDRKRLDYASLLELTAEENSEDILSFERALSRLEERMPRAFRVVSLRFFLGCSVQETADLLETTTRTVLRDWESARTFLLKCVEQGEAA